MKVFIRVDSSEVIGTGHVMRCLALAEDLRKQGVQIIFLCRELSGDLTKLIDEKGFAVHLLRSSRSIDNHSFDQWFKNNWKLDALQCANIIRNQAADWLIIDHYAIDVKWERLLKPFARRIMVIDDLANRSHDCHLLLDQNFHTSPEKRYMKLVPDDTILLLGPKYLLLREEFQHVSRLRSRDGTINRILISFGGSDPTNETMKALKAIKTLNKPGISVDVVIGASNPNFSLIKDLANHLSSKVTIHYAIQYMEQLMEAADISIGAGGSTAWERCYLSLPAITVQMGSNQTELLKILSELGAIHHLGKSSQVSEFDIADVLLQLIHSPHAMLKMIEASRNIMKDFEPGLVARKLIGGEKE